MSRSRFEVAGFGRRVRAARERRKMTPQELARKVGVTYSQINRLERDKCQANVGMLLAIAYALGVRPGTLLEGVDLAGVAAGG